MPPRLVIGCCGWSYLQEQEFHPLLTGKQSTKLQAYAQLFDWVEVNSTFYRIPGITTAERWRQEASAINNRFQFAVKMYQGITHLDRFGRKSRGYFEAI